MNDRRLMVRVAFPSEAGGPPRWHWLTELVRPEQLEATKAELRAKGAVDFHALGQRNIEAGVWARAAKLTKAREAKAEQLDLFSAGSRPLHR